jgi:hypothetical protein
MIRGRLTPSADELQLDEVRTHLAGLTANLPPRFAVAHRPLRVAGGIWMQLSHTTDRYWYLSSIALPDEALAGDWRVALAEKVDAAIAGMIEYARRGCWAEELKERR